MTLNCVFKQLNLILVSFSISASIFQGEEIEEYNVCSQSNVKIVKVVPLPHARSEVWSYFGFIADDDGEIHDKKKTICRICATTLCYSGNTTNLFTHLKAMHPEVNPQKLAPTNKAPRTGKKSNKRKFFEDSDNLIPIEIDSNSHYIVRNVSFNSTSTPESESEQSIATSVPSTNQPPSDLLKLTNNKQNSTTFTLINNDQATASESGELITDAIVNLIVRDCRPIDLVNGKHFVELIRLLAPSYKLPQAEKLEQLVKKKYIEVRREMILRSMDDE